MVYSQCFKPCWLPQPIDCSSGYFFLFKMDGEPAAVAETYRADMQDWANFVSHSNVLLLYMRDTLLKHICMQNVFFFVCFLCFVLYHPIVKHVCVLHLTSCIHMIRMCFGLLHLKR